MRIVAAWELWAPVIKNHGLSEKHSFPKALKAQVITEKYRLPKNMKSTGYLKSTGFPKT
jgi:hypothetical protein